MIFGLIGLVLTMTTFACKRSQSPVTKARPASAPHPLPKAPEVTLERGLATEWTEVRVAYAYYVECAGTAIGDQFLITRKDDRMMINGRKEIALGKYQQIPERSLEKDEFDEIVNKLRLFYRQAKSETSEAKPFDSFPPDERERELAAYYRMLGRPYLESEPVYFEARFDPNTAGMTIRERFTDPRSAHDYRSWLQNTWKGRDSSP